MKLKSLKVLLLIIAATHIHDCNSTKRTYEKSLAERRQLLVKKIINKMTDLSSYSIKNASPKDSPQIMENIRKQLRLASKFTGARGGRYVELLMDGIQSIVASKNKFGEIETANAIESNIQDSKYDSSALSSEVSAVYEENTCDCSCIEERLCLNISSLNEFTCHKDQNIISLENVCDGENDCIDNSDEEQCAMHANKKLSDTKIILNEIKNILPKHCLEVQNSIDKVVVKTRKDTLSKVLKKQQEVLRRVAPIKIQKKKEEPINKVKEISHIVSSVEAALEGALCIREKYKTVIRRRNGLSVDNKLDVLNNKKSWAPPICTCTGQICLQDNCTSTCNNTCWQRFSLGRWVCQSVIATSTVALDLVCDGKVDCCDESDEKGCTAGAGADKFQATQLYNFIIESLGTKLTSSPQVHKVIRVQEAVKNLQVQSIIEGNDAEIKRWRDETFAGLYSIYEGVLTTADNVWEVDAAYKFLMSVSQQLVEAMKHSKMGNERIVPINECHCMADKCALAECTVACVRFCAVKATITEYLCKGNSSARIPVQNMCNGERDCPEGDDELTCLTDVCRNHHLLVLRNKIQSYRDERWGHALAEILDNWKTKTISSIRITEETDRLTRPDIQKLVAATLHELAQVYATLPKLTRRSTDGTMPAFLELSRLIKDTLRDCSV